MKWYIFFEEEKIGEVITNHSMTAEEICNCAGIKLAITQEDFENMPKNGKYDLDSLSILDANSIEKHSIKTYHIIDDRERNVKNELIHYTFEELKNYFEPDANELPEEYKEWENIHDLFDLEAFLKKSYAGMAIPYTFEEVEEFKSSEQIERANHFLKLAK